ncbi:MAG: DUF1826 domain-containing protein [Deltaproteobacteria bacterium]|nr:DUF1826 domain-containing protein [Deltaproteobacteria bacterium]
MAFALSRSVAEPGYLIARSPAELAWTRASKFGVGVWPRALPAVAARRFSEAARSRPIAVETTVDLASPQQARQAAAQMGDPLLAAFVCNDLRRLLPTFAAITGENEVVVRLHTIRDGMCEKLHADYVTLRMLCTYTGPGTQWVAPGDVVRENLRRIDVPVEEANASVLRHPGALRQARAGDVLVLKGEQWPGGTGAVHRSPPVGPSAPPRLLLRIDAKDRR